MNPALLGLGTYRLRTGDFESAVLRAAMSPETAWVDTAPNYMHGQAHALLAPLLVGRRLSVSTKVGFLTDRTTDEGVKAGVLSEDEASRGHSLNSEFVHWQCSRNRVELGRNRLGLVFVHNPEFAPGDTAEHLRSAFLSLEAEAAAGLLDAYGVATWDGFDSGKFSVPALERLAVEAAGTAEHHLRAIQLPVSLVTATAFEQALAGRGPITEAAGRGWDVFASAPLFGGELPELATRELADLLSADLGVSQACLLAVASCPGVTRVLLSASSAEHWSDARAALAEAPIPVPSLRKVLDVLSAP